MAGFSFTGSGATPSPLGYANGPAPSPIGIGSTPASKALSNAATPSGQYVTPRPPTPPAIPSPSTAVKKTTVNNLDGSSHVTEYHAPIQPATSGLISQGQTPATDPAGGGGHAIIPSDPQSSSGAVVNSSTGGLVSAPSLQPNTSTSFSGLLGGLASFNPFANSTVSGAYQKAQDIQGLLEQSRKNEANAEAENRLNPIPIGDQTGREAIIKNQYLAQQNALSQQGAAQASIYGAGFTGTGQQQSAQSTAAGLAQPQLAGFNQQVFNPATGQLGSGGLPQEAQTFVSSLAKQVLNGQMTRSDAESRLTAYGQPGVQALDAALGGTNFNTNASNASAATTATGQQIQAAIAPANQALDALQQAYTGLSAFQQGSAGVGNIPLLSQLVQNASLAFGPGREAASAYQGALQEARSRIDAALVGSIGVNAAAAQASALLPDNMLPSELPQKIAAAKQYLQNQLASYTSSGQQNKSPAGTTNPTGGIIQTPYGAIDPTL